jgi:hypothetical protein
LEDVALVAGTQQNLGNLYSLDIYGWMFQKVVENKNIGTNFKIELFRKLPMLTIKVTWNR